MPGVEGPSDSGRHCGLVAYEVFHPDYVERFADMECAELPEPVLANCAARLYHHFTFRVMQRYARVEAGAMRGICEKIPLRCSNPVVYELLALEAHNYSLRSFPNADFSATSAQLVQQQKQRVKAVVAAVVPRVYERLSQCESVDRDCSCAEGLLVGRSCQPSGEAEAPDESETEWL